LANKNSLRYEDNIIIYFHEEKDIPGIS
jgi:hypothetical protein